MDAFLMDFLAKTRFGTGYPHFAPQSSAGAHAALPMVSDAASTPPLPSWRSHEEPWPISAFPETKNAYQMPHRTAGKCLRSAFATAVSMLMDDRGGVNMKQQVTKKAGEECLLPATGREVSYGSERATHRCPLRSLWDVFATGYFPKRCFHSISNRRSSSIWSFPSPTRKALFAPIFSMIPL